MAKQTSIEWFWDKFVNEPIKMSDLIKILEQAKQMHRQEIIDAWDDGNHAYFYSKKTSRDFTDGSEYYNEVYGGQDNG